MTEQFFDKALACREIEAIPGLLEFDIPVRGTIVAGLRKIFKRKK